jgi:hypothetical protein
MNTAHKRITSGESALQNIAMLLARLTLAYLFFTQLWWKVPPSFGCPADYAVTAAGASGPVKRTSGLCDWIGVEAAWSDKPHPILAADLSSINGPRLSVDIGFLAAGNGLFLKNFAIPNIRWFGYFVFGMESFIFFSLFFGLFSRVGGLVALAQSLQLWIGLAGIGSPPEWEWSYNWLIPLSLLMIAYPAGRFLGLDALLYPRLMAAAQKGSRLAGWLALLT